MYYWLLKLNWLTCPPCSASASSSALGSRPPRCRSTGRALGEHWVSTGWTLGEFWASIGWILGHLHVKVGIQGVIWSVCATEEVAEAGGTEEDDTLQSEFNLDVTRIRKQWMSSILLLLFLVSKYRRRIKCEIKTKEKLTISRFPVCSFYQWECP